MAITAQLLYRGAAPTSNTTLYTASANTEVTNIIVANTASSAATFTIELSTGGSAIAILSGVSVPANTSAFFDLKQYVANGQTVQGYASATTVNFHISGATGF
jgi:hypothetical protein